MSDDAALLANVEQWLSAVGIYFDREGEIREELFDKHRGRLKKHPERDQPEFQARLMAIWRAGVRTGQRLEREQEERLKPPMPNVVDLAKRRPKP